MEKSLKLKAIKNNIQTKYKLNEKSKVFNAKNESVKKYLKEFEIKNNQKIPKTLIKIDGEQLKIKTTVKIGIIEFDNDKLLGNQKLTTKKIINKNGYIIIPKKFPFGYHKLILGKNKYFLISCPKKLNLPKSIKNKQLKGIMVNLYSVRSANSWGIGDFEDLKTLIKKTAEKHGDFISINPLHAAFNGINQFDSPYSPSSKLFLNPIYIRPEKLKYINQLPKTKIKKVLLLHKKAIKMNLNKKIDRNKVWKLKQKALKIIFKNSATNINKYQAFTTKNGKFLKNYINWAVANYYGKTPNTVSNNFFKNFMMFYF